MSQIDERTLPFEEQPDAPWDGVPEAEQNDEAQGWQVGVRGGGQE